MEVYNYIKGDSQEIIAQRRYLHDLEAKKGWTWKDWIEDNHASDMLISMLKVLKSPKCEIEGVVKSECARLREKVEELNRKLTDEMERQKENRREWKIRWATFKCGAVASVIGSFTSIVLLTHVSDGLGGFVAGWIAFGMVLMYGAMMLSIWMPKKEE